MVRVSLRHRVVQAFGCAGPFRRKTRQVAWRGGNGNGADGLVQVSGGSAQRFLTGVHHVVGLDREGLQPLFQRGQ